MEVIAIEYFPNSIYPGKNEKTVLNSCINDDNEKYACGSYDHMFHQLKIL